MFKFTLVFVSVFVLVLGGCSFTTKPVQSSSSTTAVYHPVIADMISKVNQIQIYKTIYDLTNFTTRRTGSAGNTNAATYLYNRFMAIPELWVEYQGGSNKNVIATYNGSGANVSEVYIIGAHYDSYSSTPGVAPGATDDATGCAIVLEFARIMSQYEFNSTLKFACWNGEEDGQVGSSNYASYASSSSLDIKLNLNYDSTAYDPSSGFILDILYDTPTTNVKDLEVQHNSLYGIGFSSFTYKVHDSCGSDHDSFRYYGFPAISSHTELHGPQYHQSTDTVDKVNTEFAKKNAQIGMSAIAWLAGIYSGAVTEFSFFLMLVLMSGPLVFAVVWRLQNR